MKILKVLRAVVVGVAAIIVVVGVLAVTNVIPAAGLFNTSTETSDSQVITSVTEQEEVALLALGIQGVARSDSKGEIFGVEVPAGDRTTLIQYEFTGKVGIDGRDVIIDGGEDGEYLVTIPRFIFIGFSEPRFEDPIESNGAVSWLTPEIDETAMINTILSDSNQQQYVDQNVDALRSQAETFYRGIITGIEPTAQVTFEFTQ